MPKRKPTTQFTGQQRETVGAISAALAAKQPETRSPVELEQELQKDYIDNLILCIEESKKVFPNLNLYIVVLTKNEKLLTNVFNNKFFCRLSCPTPDYDQSVFRYHYKDECIDYLWTIPSKDTCHHLLNNAHLVVESERELLNFVRLFAEGTLFNIARSLNKEHEQENVMFINNKKA